MTRAVTWIVLITAVGAATGLFLLKNQVQSLETALRAERNAIRTEYKAIEVLEAEWSYLNNPERLSRLADQFLDLKPLTMTQTLPLEAIPIWPAAVADETRPDEGGTPVSQIAPTLAAVRVDSRPKGAQ